MKILCIGEALIDMICTDKGKTLAAGNHFLKKPGGAPTNVAAAIAALGGEVELAAKVGNDPFGKQLINVMENFGVETKAMLTDPDHFTTFAFVSLMENGERDFVFNRGADGLLTKEEVDAIDLSNVHIIHFGSATAFLPGPLQEAYLHLLNKALQQKIYISFDPNYRHLLFPNNTQSFIDQSWHFLEHCNYFKLSDEEAMLITQTNSLESSVESLLKKTKAVFTITLGKDGTMIGLNNEYHIVDSIPINAIDTTGAGDAFVGAILYQLSHRSKVQMSELNLGDWRRFVANANKAGARTCEYMGAMEAFAHLNNQIFN
ncbi:MAG: carbohydrate kinase [Sediminibacterium sp.]|nr:carbohydrate kinase [Sediminibacterium sp.]